MIRKVIIIHLTLALFGITLKSQNVENLHKQVKDLNLNLPEEIALYYKILEQDSTNYEAIFGMANAYYSRWRILGKIDDVYLDSAIIQYNKACLLPKADYKAFMSRGELYYENNNIKLAYNDFSVALNQKPDLFSARWKKAKILIQNGQYKDALADLDIAIIYHKKSDFLYRLRATCFAQIGEFKNCKKDVQKALKIKPLEYENYLLKADYYAIIGEYKKALVEYDQILTKNPYYSIAYLKRANVYNALGLINKANKDWNIAESRGYIINNTSKTIFFGVQNVQLKEKTTGNKPS